MNYIPAMDTADDTKNRILHAAEARFRHYGFGKTTMEEIARDCHMSAANIYRFFKSKKDIAAEMASWCFAQSENALKNVVRQPGPTAAERVELFILHMLKINHELYSGQPKINELVEFIVSERPDMIEDHKEAKRSLLAVILADGERNGEFCEINVVETAETILKSCYLLAYPSFMVNMSYAELENFARSLARLILNGIKKR